MTTPPRMTTSPLADPHGLALPVSGDRLHGREAGQQRRLSDLLPQAPADQRCHMVWLMDVEAARAACRRGENPVLYHAYRDVLPARHHASPNADSHVLWYADLVVYQPGILPGGELHRSIGHWNTPAQLEIFHVLSGRVLMLTAHGDATGHPVLHHHEAGAGDLVAVPFGAWHITYVLNGPAAVFNVYTDVPTIAQAHSSRHAAHDDGLKYRSRPSVQVAAVRHGTGFAFARTTHLCRWGPIRPAPAPRWAEQIIGVDGLPAFYQHATTSELDALGRAAHTHLPPSRM